MKKQIWFPILFFLVMGCWQAKAQDENGQKQNRRHRTEAIAQVFKDTFNFVQLRNDPANMANLSLHFDPFYFELYGLNSNLGYDASLKYRLHNTLAVEAGYKGSYFESVEKANINQTGTFGGPATGTSNVQTFHVNADYAIKTNLDTNIESVKIGVFRGFMLVEHITSLFQMQYGIRAGFQYFQTFVSGDQVPFSGYYENDPSKRVVNFGIEQLGTMMEENIINLGASITGRHDLVISNHTLGQNKIQNETYIYADILYAPSIAYANVIAINYENISREKYTDFNVNDNTPKSRFGFQAGFDYSDLSHVGLSFGMEAGFRPGPSFLTGLFVTGKFGIALNTKI